MEDENFDAEYAAEAAEEEADCQRKAEPPPALDHAEFLTWRSPRTAEKGPALFNNPLCHWLVRTRHSAYSANDAFDGPSAFEAGPMWCFDRMGMSKTMLPNGRVVHIGGEHEDHYDPDFFIYNDVVAVDTDGSIAVYGYAPEEFPPTDFHSATLVGGAIIIVGCLGYPEQRVEGHTPVFRLDVETMLITPVLTSGEAPGWIHRHSAELDADGCSIIIRGGELWLGPNHSMQKNIDAWSLDVASGHWTRLSHLDSQRWTMIRVDRKPNRLWDIRQELWRREHGWEGQQSYWQHADEPDFEALAALYRIDARDPAPEEGANYNVYRVVIDGVVVEFTEERWMVHAIVEGRLSDRRLADLQSTTLALLQRLDASDWEIEAK